MGAKRVLDLIVASLALVVAAPMLLAVALVMRISGDRGPFLYQARRVGEGASIINVLKIRTMPVGTGGSTLTLSNDARVTPVGRVIRRFRVDELPQLLNVLRGEMSLVGPRPEDPRYVELSDPLQRRVFAARPGITGLAQLEFHNEAAHLRGPDPERCYREEILPAKLRLDAEYLDRQSILLDLEILARTVITVLRPRSVSKRPER